MAGFFRVRRAESGPRLRVRGLGGGVPTFEAWLTAGGSSNTAISPAGTVNAFSSDGQGSVIPWDAATYRYEIVDAATTDASGDHWGLGTAALLARRPSSGDARFAVGNAGLTSVSASKIRYTATPREPRVIAGYLAATSNNNLYLTDAAGYGRFSTGGASDAIPASQWQIDEFAAHPEKFRVAELVSYPELQPLDTTLYNIVLRTIPGSRGRNFNINEKIYGKGYNSPCLLTIVIDE